MTGSCTMGRNARLIASGEELCHEAGAVDTPAGEHVRQTSGRGKAMFYQLAVQEDDQWKLIVKTHRGQEIANSTPIGYCGGLQHVQRISMAA